MGRRAKVLLMDDSNVSLIVAEALLVEAGYDVRTASDLRQFEQQLSDWAPDIILTDVQMPGLSGADLCRRIKQHETTAQVPVVLYSSMSKDRLEALASECGADAFVCKAERHEQLPRQLAAVWASLRSSR